MKANLLKNISVLSITVLLAACSSPKDNPAATKVANPNLHTVNQDEVKVTITESTCSKEVIDALNAVMSQSKIDVKSEEKDSLVLIQKACETFDKAITKQMGDFNCRSESELDGATESKLISKDTTKEFCGSVTATLNPEAAKTTESGSEKSVEAKTESSKSSTEGKAAGPSVEKKQESTEEKASTKKAATVDTKIADMKKGLLFTIKKLDVLQTVLLNQNYIEDGVLVESTTDLDSTLSNCILADMSAPIKVTQDQVLKMTDIKIEERTLTLSSDDKVLTVVCQQPLRSEERTKPWGLAELTKALDTVIDIKPIE